MERRAVFGRPGPVLKRILLYGGLLLVAWTLFPHLVRMMIYPVPSERVPEPPPAPIAEVALTTASGESVSAWFLPCPREQAPVLVFFHGNGQNLGSLLYSGFLHRFQEYEVHLLALDYPGYGNSGGIPSEASLMESAELAMDWVLANFPNAPKILMGWSLGAAVAVEMSARFQGHHDGLVLMSPWTSIQDVARVHYPSFLVGFFLKEQYDSRAAARRVTVPSLVIHGREDEIIPAEQGRELATILGKAGLSQLVIVADREHNDLLNAALTWTHLHHFLSQFGNGGEG